MHLISSKRGWLVPVVLLIAGALSPATGANAAQNQPAGAPVAKVRAAAERVDQLVHVVHKRQPEMALFVNDTAAGSRRVSAHPGLKAERLDRDAT